MEPPRNLQSLRATDSCSYSWSLASSTCGAMDVWMRETSISRDSDSSAKLESLAPTENTMDKSRLIEVAFVLLLKKFYDGGANELAF